MTPTDDPPTPDEIESWDQHDTQDALYVTGLYDEIDPEKEEDG